MTLKVRCKVYDAKPPAKISWEFGTREFREKRLDESNPRRCVDPKTFLEVNCFHIITQERQQKNDLSLWTTESILKIRIGRESPAELKCLAHHPALGSPQRTSVILEMVDKGELISKNACPFIHFQYVSN